MIEVALQISSSDGRILGSYFPFSLHPMWDLFFFCFNCFLGGIQIVFGGVHTCSCGVEQNMVPKVVRCGIVVL